MAGAAQDWYAHKVGGTSGIGGGAAGPWYRVLAITPNGGRGSAEQDYVEILPAALHAARHRRPFIAGWLSRGGGAPLELITNAGPLPEPAPASRPAHSGQDQPGPAHSGPRSGSDQLGPAHSGPRSGSDQLGPAHSGPRSGSDQFGPESAGSAQPGSSLAGPSPVGPESARPGLDRPGPALPGSSSAGLDRLGSQSADSDELGSSSAGSDRLGDPFGLALPWLAQPAAAQPARVVQPGLAHPGLAEPGAARHSRAQPRSAQPLSAQTGPAQTGPVELLFPAGARGVPIPDAWLADLDRLVWAPCPARQAPPLAAGNDQRGWHRGQPLQVGQGQWGGQRADTRDDRFPLFESTLTTLMSRPFGWLVVAEPTDIIDEEIAELRTQLNVLRRYEEERARIDVERAERRLAELDAFREAGLWNVRVLAGAASERELSLIAPVLVGSVGLAGHPYRLRSVEGVHDLADALVVKLSDAGDGAQVPFAATAGTLAALTGLPRAEVPGVRLLEPSYFDVTSETRATRAIDLGEILDGQDRPVGRFRVPLGSLNRHALVAGATGSGKSQTVRHMLEQLTRAGIPWLAIEPVKSEYAVMAGRIAGSGQVTVINPSDSGAVPLSVNPLAPEPGYPVQAHIDMVRALFLAAFAADEPFPQIISQALQRVYTACGWDTVTGAGVPGAPAGPVIPTLAQLQRAAIEVIDDVGYGRELQADVRGFVDVRLRSLRIGSAGRFFEGGHPADIGELLRRNVVLAIEDVANDEDKAFLIGTLIIRIVEYLHQDRGVPAATGPPR